MMGGFARWASSHVGACVGSVLLFTFICASSVARCCAIHPPAGAPAAESPESIAEEALPEEMRALRGSYTDVTRDAISMLAANAWTDGQGAAAVTFTERAIRTATQGGESWEAFAVAASSRATVAGDGAVATVTTMCLGTAEWTDIATLTVPADGSGSPATFRCASVCGGAELALSPELKRVSLDGPEPKAFEVRGTSTEAAESALSSWCALWRPTATAAAWTHVILEHHEERVWRLPYRLDDQRGSEATLVIPMDGGEIRVEEGGR